MNQKGITPVIAVILLLLITISMVGFAFVWFSRVAQTATQQTENQLNNDLARQGKKVAIDNLQASSAKAAGSVTVRNIGTSNIAGSEINVYIGGKLTPCSTITTLAVGAAGSCPIPINQCPDGSGIVVKVTAPGNQDQSSCGTGSGAPSAGAGAGTGTGGAPPPPGAPA